MHQYNLSVQPSFDPKKIHTIYGVVAYVWIFWESKNPNKPHPLGCGAPLFLDIWLNMLELAFNQLNIKDFQHNSIIFFIVALITLSVVAGSIFGLPKDI